MWISILLTVSFLRKLIITKRLIRTDYGNQIVKITKYIVLLIIKEDNKIFSVKYLELNMTTLQFMWVKITGPV